MEKVVSEIASKLAITTTVGSSRVRANSLLKLFSSVTSYTSKIPIAPL
jgi:hypothetical protein